MHIQTLLDKLWQQYCHDTPMVETIYKLFLAREKKIVNDHIALRTFNDPRVSISVLAKPFLDAGYIEGGEYHFEIKKLFAKHYEHENPAYPKVFISELLTEKFSIDLQDTVQNILNTISEEYLENPEKLLTRGVSWTPVRYKTYQALLAESEYAAWLYAFGFRANHFTVNVNQLTNMKTIEDVNEFLIQHKIPLNTSGGAIKGTPDELLEQSSTKAFPVKREFEEGFYSIPLAYYEFALRYPKPNGELYSGFVTASADKIFESTDNS
ncbi:MAG: succinyldiaminopimelate aminotransferase [Legionellales bacterium]|nr:succinyldiaminopimelate aminotransferase [Legionellales bacterium]